MSITFFPLPAWVSSLAVSTYYLFFPLGAILSERYGCWVVALIGCLTCSVGLLSSSFVASFPVLYLTYSLIWGLGASLVYFADLLILTKYFKARLALANGITALGGAIGGSVLNPTLQQLFIHIGFANTFRVLSSAFFVLSVFALLFRPRCRADVQSSKRRQEIFDWTIVRNTRYLVWVGVVFILMLGYMAPFVHLVSHSLTQLILDKQPMKCCNKISSLCTSPEVVTSILTNIWSLPFTSMHDGFELLPSTTHRCTLSVVNKEM